MPAGRQALAPEPVKAVEQAMAQGPPAASRVEEDCQLDLLGPQCHQQDKVDHPDTGSKDVADAVCGATFNALMSKDASAGPSGVPAVLTGAADHEKPHILPIYPTIKKPSAVVFDT